SASQIPAAAVASDRANQVRSVTVEQASGHGPRIAGRSDKYAKALSTQTSASAYQNWKRSGGRRTFGRFRTWRVFRPTGHAGGNRWSAPLLHVVPRAWGRSGRPRPFGPSDEGVLSPAHVRPLRPLQKDLSANG